MQEASKSVILIAEDDDDQYELTSTALGELRSTNRLRRVVDGQELMDYLLRRGEYANPLLSPKPALILLDLNMPRKDGREALREIKSHRELRSIPVTVLSVSRDPREIERLYDLGLNSYISKPVRYEEYQSFLQTLQLFWLEVARLPEGS